MPSPLKRRDFLRTGAGAAAAAFLPTTRLFAGDPPCALGQLTTAEIDGLATSLSPASGIVLPTDASYDTVRTIFNGLYNPLPPIIVEAGATADVATTVNWCRERDIHPRIRCGGHSFAAYSSGDTVVIDIRPMSQVTLDSKNQASIGAGANLGQTYCELYKELRTLPAGSCPPVGISGLTMVGGIGSLTRPHGLTLDRATAAEVVLADGSIVTASETSEPGLFWALRGAGSGSYGVVTEWTFDSVPYVTRDKLWMYFNWSDLVPVLTGWQTWLDSIPSQLATFFSIFAKPQTMFQIILEGNADDPVSLDTRADELADLIGIPTTNRVGPGAIDPPNCEWPYGVSYGTHKSRVTSTPIAPEGIEIIKSAFEEHAALADLKGTIAFLSLDALGGAVSDVPHEATSWVHRDAIFSAQFGALWDELGLDPVAEKASTEWLAKFYDNVFPYFDGGCYQGYWDPDVENWPEMYYGDAYTQLRTIKSAYDPENFFRFQRSIPLI